MELLLSGAAGGLLLPAALVVLFFLGAVARRTLAHRLPGRPVTGPGGATAGRRGAGAYGTDRRGAGATATEELHALLYPGKRAQLEQRRVELVLRDDEHDGAPKRTGIDLAGGTALIRRRAADGGR
ncbi:DUF6191 domain-containing protein [Kitasatospora sp. CM 4170]|uniref:DUF6191 domain-containing protein n=1 Tax=Kitasatospora aburaviensis TaxID=67265 RepID=A0ABW1F975_9ACTN|nr:DUF6191 domain-containing protein [Kitasatospora sp. CM 4170]WNM48834.1 DUF6191 domain-containing protein [Kitasatospora sp. CM 4170]